MAGKLFGDWKQENLQFEIWPRIVPVGEETLLQVRAVYPHPLAVEGAEFSVRVMPMEGLGQSWSSRSESLHSVRMENGVFCIPYRFLAEQEYQVEIIAEETVCLRVYALETDLFSKRPWRGDIHMHSHASDGREAPAFVASACRRIGLDFMAVTDHGKYAPSVEAQSAFADVPVDLLIGRGEEVHPPGNPVHMIAHGASESVNRWMHEEAEGYEAAVTERMDAVEDISDPELRRQIASCCVVFDRIREWGGLGVFCHPYWKVREGYHIAGDLTSWMFRHQPYDAYELIGGYHRYEADSNTLQVARYHEERAAGRHIPIVGVSDAHGCAASPLFGWCWTIVWSEERSQASIHAAIRSGYSVAVEAMEGEVPRAYGPFRLVKLALFLMREVFPAHDALCEEEGEAMLSHLRGESSARERLEKTAGRVETLYRRLWA